MKHLLSQNFPLKKGLILALCAGLGLSSLALSQPPAYARKAKKEDAPIQKDFLPPVASINGPLDIAKLKVQNTDDTLEVVTLSAVSAPTLATSSPLQHLDTDLGIREADEEFQALSTIQQALDEEDLRALWEATVENNPVIRFSLEKISTPTDLQASKSSRFLNKTLSVLISGAAMGSAMLPGGSGYRTMGTMATGDAVRNIINGKTQPQGTPLSATEQIQLAGLIDELQGSLIHTYHEYKNTLQALSNAHRVTIDNNNLYSQALSSGNDLASMAAGSSYYKALLAESGLRQQAKIARVKLERLAGQDAVKNLKLSVAIETETGDTEEPAEAAPATVKQPSPEKEAKTRKKDVKKNG